ncbi:MAG: 50S ribosomal protein L10 [Candidatus Cloacimonetes bacterium]|nr:50S ribosomal protein L10 [Candidatus Cloacimonadota bacterium]
MVQSVKYDIVAQLKERMEGAKAIVLVDYKGISVEQVNQLRNQYREAKVDYLVQKNTLVKIALNYLGITELDEYLQGPTAIAICKDEEVAPAKVLVKFIKDVMEEAQFPSFKAGLVAGQVFDQAQLQELAKLPSREEMLAKIMGSLNAPLSNFMNVSQGVARKLVYALDAVAKTKAS